MIRLLFTLVMVGVLTTALSQQPAVAQEKTEAKEVAATDPTVVQATTKWFSFERASALISSAFLALILFQLIMLRGSIERLNEKMGASN